MTVTQHAETGTRFDDLAPGNIVRIPPPRGPLTAIVVMAPAAEVLTAPTACPCCSALIVATREIESGIEAEVHRLPGRPVIVITETPEA